MKERGIINNGNERLLHEMLNIAETPKKFFYFNYISYYCLLDVYSLGTFLYLDTI